MFPTDENSARTSGESCQDGRSYVANGSGIKEGDYIYGNEIQYADFVLGSILIWMLRAREEDFEKVVKAADVQDWWKDISQYMLNYY